ncbi:DUF2510 domain-containing protein [Microbacterium paraoxydans]|uniref:DUF2510 domain-containing protein n=1 Tax=Microbacterium paraoxydans TaxID=199592 RepID=A0A1H1NYJ8_9MICO|nr:DUF2510 domain-containing protein [Microbacterium paraoxydans]SDS04066.1 Protein of unknown function [Microbacterium paraoxydans]
MTTPAGWYDDGSGRLRWWDGQQWTEHFAPETTATTDDTTATATDDGGAESTPAATDDGAPLGQEPTATAETVAPEPVAAEREIAPDEPATEFIVAPEPAQDWTAPTSGAHGLPGAAPMVPPATPDQNAYQGQGGYPTPGAYPGAQGAGGYPGQAPGAQGTYPGQGAYPGRGAYPGQGTYRGQAPAPAAPKKVSVLGLVGLGLAALGLLLAFIPVTLPFAWFLLAAGFIVSLISLFLKGTKWPGITGLGVSVLGGIVAIVVSIFFVLAVANTVRPVTLPDYDEGTTQSPAPETDDTGDAGTGEVAEGTLGEPVTVPQLEGTAEVTIRSATFGPTNGTDFEPANGGYLLIDVAWETLDGTTYVNPLYFSVETADGTEGDYDIFGEATLESSEQDAGSTAEGTVSFDVAESSSYVIVITDEMLQEVARVTVEPSAR